MSPEDKAQVERFANFLQILAEAPRAEHLSEGWVYITQETLRYVMGGDCDPVQVDAEHFAFATWQSKPNLRKTPVPQGETP